MHPNSLLTFEKYVITNMTFPTLNSNMARGLSSRTEHTLFNALTISIFMKVIFTSTLLFLIATTSFAQSDSYMDKIAQKSCECLDKVVNLNNPEQFNMELGLCMIEASQAYKTELKRDYNIDFAKIDVQGEELGRLIGMRMATTCPARLMEVASQMEAAGKDSDESDTAYETMRGRVTRINSDIFVEFSIRNTDARTMRFYWLSFVDSNVDLATNYESLVGKDVEVVYQSQELFDARTGQYRKLNVLTQVNVEN